MYKNTPPSGFIEISRKKKFPIALHE